MIVVVIRGTLLKTIMHKCVETIYQPPKGIAYGEDIVQTTTRKRPWRHGVVRKSVGRLVRARS